jgi:hypothetical protein
MESEDASTGRPIVPHHQTISDLQIFINSYQQEGYLVSVCMDRNKYYERVFREQDYNSKVCTPMGFHYDKNIDGYKANLVETCNLVNIHKLKYQNVPPTQSSGSTQIDFIFISSAATEFIFRCGILNVNTLFSSDHRPLYIDLYILRLLGY